MVRNGVDQVDQGGPGGRAAIPGLLAGPRLLPMGAKPWRARAGSSFSNGGQGADRPSRARGHRSGRPALPDLRRRLERGGAGQGGPTRLGEWRGLAAGDLAWPGDAVRLAPLGIRVDPTSTGPVLAEMSGHRHEWECAARHAATGPGKLPSELDHSDGGEGYYGGRSRTGVRDLSVQA